MPADPERRRRRAASCISRSEKDAATTSLPARARIDAEGAVAGSRRRTCARGPAAASAQPQPAVEHARVAVDQQGAPAEHSQQQVRHRRNIQAAAARLGRWIRIEPGAPAGAQAARVARRSAGAWRGGRPGAAVGGRVARRARGAAVGGRGAGSWPPRHERPPRAGARDLARADTGRAAAARRARARLPARDARRRAHVRRDGRAVSAAPRSSPCCTTSRAPAALRRTLDQRPRRCSASASSQCELQAPAAALPAGRSRRLRRAAVRVSCSAAAARSRTACSGPDRRRARLLLPRPVSLRLVRAAARARPRCRRRCGRRCARCCVDAPLGSRGEPRASTATSPTRSSRASGSALLRARRDDRAPAGARRTASRPGEPGDALLVVSELVRHKRVARRARGGAPRARADRVVGSGPDHAALRGRLPRGRVPRPRRRRASSPALYASARAVIVPSDGGVRDHGRRGAGGRAAGDRRPRRRRAGDRARRARPGCSQSSTTSTRSRDAIERIDAARLRPRRGGRQRRALLGGRLQARCRGAGRAARSKTARARSPTAGRTAQAAIG